MTVRGPNGPATSHRFQQDTISIGRSDENDLVLHDPSSSRRHAELRRRGEEWILRDCGSRNGTLVAGRTVSGETRLLPGDEIVVGGTVLTFAPENVTTHPSRPDRDTDAWTWQGVQTGRTRQPSILVGRSPAVQLLLSTIGRVASSPATVLVRGESGSGKELVARMLHERSTRRDQSFVVVNCPALPGSLLEAELFGVARNVATGVDERTGRIEAADGGTLFLDEIGDLELSAQAKILRFMQDRVVERVGGRTGVTVDVRVIAATHHALERAITVGAFRHDLFHRLAVVTLQVPSLRERKEDIPLLAAHFLDSFHQGARELSPEAMAILLAHDWPGNVRELEHALHQAHLMCASSVIRPEDLPPSVRAPLSGLADDTQVLRGDVDLLLARILHHGESFWDVAAQPFLKRELTREQVRELVAKAHSLAGGSYKSMAKLFRIEEQHKKLLDFLNHHDLGVKRGH